MTKVLLAGETDVELLRDIALKAFRDDSILYGKMPPDIDSVKWHIMHIKSGMYYKIIYERKTVGGIKLFDFGNGHFRLGTIYIDPDYHNKKIGTEAISLIEKQFSHVKKWSLDTPYKSYRNHHFYEKLGYVKIGEECPEHDKEFYLFKYEKCL